MSYSHITIFIKSGDMTEPLFLNNQAYPFTPKKTYGMVFL